MQHFVDSIAGASHDATGKGRFFDERDQIAWYLFLGPLPDGRPGIVHIGFEAVDGLDVETVRHQKVMASVAQFDPHEKALEYVYVHWFAPESPPNTAMAFDETCHWQAVRPTGPRPLDSGLLMLPPDVESRDGVHWRPPVR